MGKDGKGLRGLYTFIVRSVTKERKAIEGNGRLK